MVDLFDISTPFTVYKWKLREWRVTSKLRLLILCIPYCKWVMTIDSHLPLSKERWPLHSSNDVIKIDEWRWLSICNELKYEQWKSFSGLLSVLKSTNHVDIGRCLHVRLTFHTLWYYNGNSGMWWTFHFTIKNGPALTIKSADSPSVHLGLIICKPVILKLFIWQSQNPKNIIPANKTMNIYLSDIFSESNPKFSYFWSKLSFLVFLTILSDFFCFKGSFGVKYGDKTERKR